MSEFNEPWRIGNMHDDEEEGFDSIQDSTGRCIYYVEEGFEKDDPEYALCERIVACVNAFAGVPTEQIRTSQAGGNAGSVP